MKTAAVRLAATLTATALAFGTSGWPALADPTSGQPGPDFWAPPTLSQAEILHYVGLLGAQPGPDDPGLQFQGGCIAPAASQLPLTTIPDAQQALNVTQAQQFATGAGQTVAVIDTGVNPHPDLAGRVTPGGDYVGRNDGNGMKDCDGHGTLTAGIIAARTDSATTGFTGVAPDAHIIAIRQTSQAFKDQQGNTAGDPVTLAEAIVHAVAMHPNVITTSVDICQPVPPLDSSPAFQALHSQAYLALEAAVEWAYQNNIVVVNSAGNITNQPDPNQVQGQSGRQSPCTPVPQNDDPNPNNVKQIEFPAIYSKYLLSVASVNPRPNGTQVTKSPGAVSSFSEWGPWVNIAAPGEGIVSIDPGIGAAGLVNEFAEGNQAPGPIQGTSFAAPYVAGVVALVRQKYPDLDAGQVIRRIEVTAQHPSGPDGRNVQVGYGVIDPVAALTSDVPGQYGVPAASGGQIAAQLPMGQPKDWTPMRVALLGTAGCLALLVITLFTVRTRRRGQDSTT